MTSRIRNAALALATVALAALLLDYWHVRSKERQLSSVVTDFGGRMGSLPAWPLGTEYRITFERPLSEIELNQLTIANRMRGWVGSAFRDCELSAAEKATARKALPDCHLFVIDGDRRLPMGNQR